jgi:hypothetical protein
MADVMTRTRRRTRTAAGERDVAVVVSLVRRRMPSVRQMLRQ